MASLTEVYCRKLDSLNMPAPPGGTLRLRPSEIDLVLKSGKKGNSKGKESSKAKGGKKGKQEEGQGKGWQQEAS